MKWNTEVLLLVISKYSEGHCNRLTKIETGLLVSFIYEKKR